MSMCTANRWTKLVLLYNKASHMSWKGLKLFWGRVPLPSIDSATTCQAHQPPYSKWRPLGAFLLVKLSND